MNSRFQHEQSRWFQGRLHALPPELHSALTQRHARDVRNYGYRRANSLVRTATVDYLNTDDQKIIDQAAQHAQAVEACTKIHDQDSALLLAFARCDAAGVAYPVGRAEKIAGTYRVTDINQVVEPGPLLARLSGEKWWRRALRTKTTRDVESVARESGIVHLQQQPYISDAGVRAWAVRQSKNAQTLAQTVASCEVQPGELHRMSLADVAAGTVANPEIRRAELMTRISGFEHWAQRSDYACVFYTVTCPSRFHRMSVRGRRNPRYDGSKPREAQQYLRDLWARCRAYLHRREVRPVGFRVAEPQQDGTPHWHLLLFVRADDEPVLTQALRDYALRENPNEPGAKKYRFDAKKLSFDPDSGRSAAGYIAKYVAKNIDGFGIESDLYGIDARDSAVRVRAWASIWGIRQFQQIGGPGVTIWRELRRLREAVEDSAIEAARQAADSGQWDLFHDQVDREPLRLGKLRPTEDAAGNVFDAETGEVLERNQYGELPADRVQRVESSTGSAVTRSRVWQISYRARQPEIERTIKKIRVVFDPLRRAQPVLAALPPRTRENNCTTPKTGGPFEFDGSVNYPEMERENDRIRVRTDFIRTGGGSAGRFTGTTQ